MSCQVFFSCHLSLFPLIIFIPVVPPSLVLFMSLYSLLFRSFNVLFVWVWVCVWLSLSLSLSLSLLHKRFTIGLKANQFNILLKAPGEEGLLTWAPYLNLTWPFLTLPYLNLYFTLPYVTWTFTLPYLDLTSPYLTHIHHLPSFPSTSISLSTIFSPSTPTPSSLPICVPLLTCSLTSPFLTFYFYLWYFDVFFLPLFTCCQSRPR